MIYRRSKSAQEPGPSADRMQILRSERPLAEKFARCWIPIAAIFYLIDLLRQTAGGLTNGSGRPFGDDFINYWSGAYLAWHGRAAEIYDWQAFHAFQQQLVGATLDFYHYSYPPVLLLLTAPLAVLPYVPALAVWLLSSWACFYAALRLAAPRGNALLLALAAPAVFVNAVGGQNGAWTAALLGGGLSVLEKRPALAGTLFGLLLYKPQVGLLLPVALLAGRRWRALAAATATAIALVALSILIFGLENWEAYFANLAVLKAAILENGSGVWHRMVSVFVFARRLGADLWTAYLVQGLAALAAAAVVAITWWRAPSAPARNAVLIAGTFLATPYLQDYDLVVGAFIVAWLSAASLGPADSGRQKQIASFLILSLPFLAALLAKSTGFAFGPLFTAPVLLITARIALSHPHCHARP